jgi:hypothetical protein
MTLALAILVGYATDTVDLHRWGQSIQMALHTALGFISIGAGIFAFAWHWENTGKPAQEDWNFEAHLNLRDFQGYQASGWIDPTFHVLRLVSVEGNEALQDMPLSHSEHQRIELVTIVGSATGVCQPCRRPGPGRQRGDGLHPHCQRGGLRWPHTRRFQRAAFT